MNKTPQSKPSPQHLLLNPNHNHIHNSNPNLNLNKLSPCPISTIATPSSSSSSLHKQVLTPHLTLGLSPSISFVTLLNESTVAYISGCSLIIENMRTLQQEIVWTADSCLQIVQVVDRIINYGPLKVAVLGWNCYEGCYQVSVFWVDWNTYFYRRRAQIVIKLNQFLAQPPSLLPSSSSILIPCLTLNSDGEHLLLSITTPSSKPTHTHHQSATISLFSPQPYSTSHSIPNNSNNNNNNNNNKNNNSPSWTTSVLMYSSTNGAVLGRYVQSSAVHLMRSFRVGSTSYFVVVGDRRVDVIVDSHGNSNSSNGSNSSSGSNSGSGNGNGWGDRDSPVYTSWLIHQQHEESATLKTQSQSQSQSKPQPQQLFSRFHHNTNTNTNTNINTNNNKNIQPTTTTATNFNIDQYDSISQIQFTDNSSTLDRLLGFLLTQCGIFYIFGISQQFGIANLTRIDMRMDLEMGLVVDMNMNMNVNTKRKSQDKEKDKVGLKQATIKFIGNNNTHNNNAINDALNWIRPSCFRAHNNRVMLSYPNNRKLVYLTFSLLNFSNYSVHYTENQIYLPLQTPNTEQSLSDSLSSQTTMTMASMQEQQCNHSHIYNHNNHNNREHNQRASNSSIKLKQFMHVDQVKYDDRSMRDIVVDKDKDKDRGKQVDLYVRRIVMSTDVCTAALMTEHKGNKYIIIVDVLTSLLQDFGLYSQSCGYRGNARRNAIVGPSPSLSSAVSNNNNSSNNIGNNNSSNSNQLSAEDVSQGRYTGNTGDKVFGNFSCKGTVKSVTYNQKQSSIFILYQTTQKQVYLSYYLLDYSYLHCTAPFQFLQWTSPLKSTAFRHSSHPTAHCVLILHSEVPRIHFYTHEHLSEFSVSLNIPNCQCGGYSPLGDKIVMVNMAGLWVLDAYTYDVLNFIANLGGIGGYGSRVPRVIEWIDGGWDFVMDVGGMAGGCLVQVINYSKIKTLGQINMSIQTTMSIGTSYPMLNQTNLSTDCSKTSHVPKTFQFDSTNQILAYIIPNHQLRFYNMNLQILNILTIEPTYISLQKQLQLLFVGTAKGMLYIFKWPEIVYKVNHIRGENDAEVIAIKHVHQGSIVGMWMTGNCRFIVAVSETGQISVVEFLQQNSPHISRRGALAILKKSNIRPQTQITLTSQSSETRRTETIIKAIGKQVQVNRKNEKLCEQLILNLQSKVKQQKFKTELLIKDEIDCSEEEKKIRNLARRIDTMRVQIVELGGKKQNDLREQKQNFSKMLAQNFAEKDQLEQQIKIIQRKFIEQKQSLEQNFRQTSIDVEFAQSTQITQLQQDSKNHKEMQQKMQSYNKIKCLAVTETKIQTSSMVQYEYNKQLEQLHAYRNSLQNSIRKYKIQIIQIINKNNSNGMVIMELENDLNKIRDKRDERRSNKAEVQTKLAEIRVINEDLVVQNRAQQVKKQQAQKKANFVQHSHQKLITEIKKLESVYQEVKNKKLELDDQFFEQNAKKLYLNQNIAAMKQKIIKLKLDRDRIKQSLAINSAKLSRSLHDKNHQTTLKQNSTYNHSPKLSLNKNNFLSKTCADWSKIKQKKTNANIKCDTIVEPQPQQFDNSTYPTTNNNSNVQNVHEQFEQSYQPQPSSPSIHYETFVQKLQQRQIVNNRLEKLNKIKNDKIKKYKVINQKFINDHKRLISQLNQLKRYNDYLLKKQSKLKLQLKYGSLMIPKQIQKQSPQKMLASILEQTNISNNTNANAINKRVQSSSHYIENNKNKSQVKMDFVKIENIGKPSTPSHKIQSKLRKSGVISLHQNGNISYA